MNSHWIDSHSHFDAPEFDGDREQVFERALQANVVKQIIPAVNALSWAQLKSICQRFRGLFAAYGLHPMYLPDHKPSDLLDLEQWIRAENPIAVGECGLDYYVEDLNRTQQMEFFVAQLQIAASHQLPVILHARRAVDDVIQVIRKTGVRAGVVHSYSGSAEQAKQLFDLGFCLGIGGPVTYERAKRLRDIVRTMPSAFLLLETDSPDQPLFGHQGQRNEPARLIEVAQVVAQLRGIELHELASLNANNSVRVFGSRLQTPSMLQNSTSH